MKYRQHLFVCHGIDANLGRVIARIVRARYDEGLGVLQTLQSFKVRDAIRHLLYDICDPVFRGHGPEGFSAAITRGVISPDEVNHQILELAPAAVPSHSSKRLKERPDRERHRYSARADINPVSLAILGIKDILLKV